jgi:hypothetical protein
MLKAKNDSTSRRSLLKAASALAASTVAVPALAAGQEDARLLALGEEFEQYLKQRSARNASDKAERIAWLAACERAGLPELDLETTPTEVWRARNQARAEIKVPGFPDDPCDDDGASIELNRLSDWEADLLQKIFACRPRTMDGLGVLARAASLTVEYVIDHDTGWEEEIMGFVMAVCAFAGVKPAWDCSYLVEQRERSR